MRWLVFVLVAGCCPPVVEPQVVTRTVVVRVPAPPTPFPFGHWQPNAAVIQRDSDAAQALRDVAADPATNHVLAAVCLEAAEAIDGEVQEQEKARRRIEVLEGSWPR